MNRILRITLILAALFATTQFAQAQSTAVASGNWSSAATWGGTVPTGAETDIVIPMGIDVLLDMNVECGELLVQGRLEVQRADRTLTCDSLIVMGANAEFEVGTDANRFTDRFVLTLKGETTEKFIHHSHDMGARALLAMMGGTITMHGEDRVEWTRLGANVGAGANAITMSEAVDWRVGDEILICSSRLDWNESEKMEVAAVSGDGLTVTLTATLAFPHLGVIKTYTRPSDSKEWTGDMRAEVGLLSRNITIQGAADSETSGFGAHVMIHGSMTVDSTTYPSGEAYVKGVEIFRGGQKSLLARYPFHWHLCEDAGAGQYFNDNSVHLSFNRAITIHGTDYATVENNFCYDHIGHGLFLEDGVERFNVIRRNVLALTKRPAAGEEVIPSDNSFNEAQNRTPASFWITNPRNTFEDNVVAGTEGTAYWFIMPTGPTGPSASRAYYNGARPNREPLGSFARNSAHSCMNGFDIFDILASNHSITRNGGWINNNDHIMDSCTFYANDTAIYAGIGTPGYQDNVIYRNNVFIDNKIVTMLATYLQVQESVIVADSGEGLFTTERKLFRAYDGAGQIRDSHLIGWNAANANLLFNTGGAIKHVNNRFAGITTDHTGTVRASMTDFDLPQQADAHANHVGHPRFWSLILRDEDGSLSGVPNSSIISNHRFMRVGDETQPANWTRVYSSPHHFVTAIEGAGANNVSVKRSKAGTPDAWVYYIHGYQEHHQLPVIVSEDFLYTYYYESLPSNRRTDFRIDDATAGDTVVACFKDFGKLPGVSVNAPSHASLAALNASGSTGYYVEANGDLYLKMVATGQNQSRRVSWSSNPAWNEWDSDGDGLTDGTEAAIASRDPFSVLDLWAQFNSNGNFEQWDQLNGITGGQVTGGSLVGTSTGDSQIINGDLGFAATDISVVMLRFKATVNTAVELYWERSNAAGYSGTRQTQVDYTTAGAWQTLFIPVDSHAEWNDTITGLRIDPIAGAGDFEIDWIRASNGDADGDGIPDLTEGFGDIDGDGLANLDDTESDGDGTSDAAENAAGRDPYDASDLRFKFNTDGDFEGWSFARVSGNVASGLISGTATGPQNPNILNTGFRFPASSVTDILIRLKVSTARTVPLFFGTDTADSFSGTRRLNTASPSANQWGMVSFPVSTHADWTGFITRLRFDPTVAGANLDVDWVLATDGDRDDDGLTDTAEGHEDVDSDGSPNLDDKDSDGDGAPDAIESSFGRNPYANIEGAQNPDGDGQSDLFEMIAGFSPNSALSFYSQSAALDPNGDRRITFSAKPNRTYKIERSRNLTTWQQIGQLQSGSTDGNMDHVDAEVLATGPVHYRLTISVADGDSAATATTMSLTINQTPVATAQSVSLNEDVPLGITLAGTDADMDPLTYFVATSPSHGTLTGSAPNLTYTPHADYNGPDSFTFRANDGITSSTPATVSITINPVPDVPVAAAQTINVNEDGSLAITLTGSDGDNDPITFALVTVPTHGALTGTAPNLTYMPDPNYFGPDSLSFKVNDGTSDSPTATISITVTAVNDPPVATAQSGTVNEDASLPITLAGTDIENNPLTYAVATPPAHGTLTGTAPNLTYTPNANYFGPDSFTFKANDGNLDSTAATVSITINPLPDGPVAAAQSVNVDEDDSLAVTLTGSDADNDPLTFAVVSPPAHGALSGTAPNLTYTPNGDYHGPDSFTFKVNDGSTDSPTATISITVAPVNDAPVASAQSVSVDEDNPLVIVLSASDVDDDPLTYTVVTSPSNGVLSGTSPNLTYTPNADYFGPDSLTFKANDGTVDSETVTVSITVNSVIDVPVGLVATIVGTSQIDLSWNAVADATSYNLKRSATQGGAYTIVASGLTSTSASQTGLSAGTAYYYVVSAVKDSEESNDSEEAGGFTFPARPTGLAAAVVSDTRIDLSWSPVFGATSYDLKRSTTAGGPYETVGSALTSTSTSDSGLSGGTVYYYAVSAVNSGGESAPSLELGALTKPAAPTGLSGATVSDTRIDLSWNPVAGAASYTLKRSTSQGGPYTATSAGLVATSASETGLPAGARYYYVVSAINSSGESADSGEVELFTKPAIPSGLAAHSVVASQIKLSWNSVAGAGSYTLKRSTSPGGPYTTRRAGLTLASVTDFGDLDKVYYYVVSAVNGGGESVNSSEISVVPVPPRPTELTVAPVSATQADLSWHAVSGVTGYKVKRSTTIGGPYTTVTTDVTTTNTTDIGLSGGTRYYYVVSAVYNAQESADSAEAVVLTMPGSPTGLTPTTISGSQINFTWDVLPGADSYILKRSNTQDGPFTTVVSGLRFNGASFTGLTPGTGYYFVISAVNSSGEGSDSPPVSAVTLPVIPAGISATTVSDSRIDISWNAVSGADRYRLMRSTTQGGPYTTLSSELTAPGYSDTGLASVSQFFYVVNAVNVGGASGNSPEATAFTKPSQPSGLIATTISSSQIDLSWNAPTDASSYRLKRAQSAGGPFVVVASGLSTTGYNDTGLAAGVEYHYVISAVNNGVESINSTGTSAFTRPGSPGVLTATTVSTSQIDLSWNAVPGATSYDLKRGTVQDGPYTTVSSGLVSTSASDTGLSPGVAYYYVVCAVNSGGEGGNSTETVAFTKPDIPVGLLAATASDTQIDLSWSAVAGATTYDLKRSTIQGGPYTTILSGLEATSASDTGLTGGTAYHYVVSAKNTGGQSADSSEVSAFTNPARPTGLAATAVSASQVDLTWTPVAGAASYNLKRATAPGGPYTAVSTGSPAVHISDTALSGGTDYYYVVSAVNAGGESVDSTEVAVLTRPVRPSGLAAIVGSSTQVDLTWNAVPGATSYDLKRSAIPGGPYATVHSGVTVTGMSDTGLSAGTRYHYVVSALNAGGESVDSSELSVTTRPAYPASLVATVMSDTQVDLSWSPVTGAASYILKRSTQDGGPYTIVRGGLTSTSMSDTGLSGGTWYYYVVSAVNESGESADSSERGVFTHPTRPTGLTAAAASDAQINLSWTAVSGADSYRLKRSAASGGPYAIIANALTGTSASDTGLTSGTTYFYVISAMNGTGESPDSSEVAESTKPSTPADLIAIASSDTRIDLSWRAVAGATSYHLRASTNQGGPYTTLTNGLTSPAHVDEGLLAGTQYFYIVSAVNGGGESSVSSEVNTFTKPASPTGLTAEVGSTSQVGLTWAPVPGATSYHLRRSTAAGGPYTTVSTGLTDTNYNDTALAVGTPYFYVLNAVNSSGESTDSAEVRAITRPGAPSGLTATVISDTRIDLVWNAVPGAVSYNLKRSTTLGGPYTTVGRELTMNSASDTSLAAGVFYYFVVSAVNESGESIDSAAAGKLTKPANPTGLVITAASATQLDLSWDAAAGATSYFLRRSAGPNGPFTIIGLANPNYSHTGLSANSRYYYTLTAVNAGWTSNEDLEGSGYTATQSPSGLTATTVSDTEINLAWSPVVGAMSYVLKRSTTAGGPYTTVSSGLVSPTVSDTGLSAGSLYYYVVSALNTGGESLDSSEVSALTEPDSPAGLKATVVSASQVDLSWNAVSGAATYHLKRSTTKGGPYTTVSSGSSPNYSDTVLAGGTSYHYVVSAVNGGGESINSSEVSALTKPAIPTLLIATTVSDSQIDLQWNAVPGATSYHLKQSATQGGPYSTIRDELTPTTASATGLTAGTRYYFVISAENSSGEGVNSAEISALTKPAIPAGLSATVVSDSQIDLSWSAGPGADSYVLKRSTNSGGPYTTVSNGQIATSHSDTGLSAGTTYHYVVSAMNEGGGSVDSSEIRAITKPGAPANLSATTASASQIDLSWDTVLGAASYNLKQSTTQGGPFTAIATGLASANHSDTGLSAGATYYYVVSAVNSSGESIESSQTGALTKPAAPVDLTATAANASQIDLVWSPVPGATSYHVRQSPTQGGPYTTLTNGLISTNFSNTGLTANTDYYFLVTAVNTGGESVDSPEVGALTKPGSPTGLTATATSDTQIDLSWTAMPGITAYNVKRSTSQLGPYTVVSSGRSSNNHSDTGLTTGTRYYYVVSAVNNSGESIDSSEVSALPADSIVQADLVIGSMQMDDDGNGGKTLTLSIQSSGMGQNFQVQAADTPVNPTWHDIGPIFQGNGGVLTMNIPIAGPLIPHRFFIVKVWIDP